MKPNKSFESPTPGPGAYDMNSSTEKHGPITYKSPRFTSNLEKSPGPGRYGESPSKSCAGYFGKSLREELFKTERTPGPGEYNIKNLSHGPSYTMRKKKNPSSIETPGPGTHSPRFIVKKNTTHTIGNAKRTEIIVALDTPGPGTYQNRLLKSTPSWSFHGIKNTSFNSTAPGPGRYEALNTSRSTSGYSPSKAERPEIFKSTASPGPGTYEAFDIKSSRIKYTIGKAKRPEVSSKTPGPGRYEAKNLSHSFSSNFGNEPKKTLEFKSEAPAAGTYSPNPVVRRTPSYTMGKKLDKKPGNGVPGPGSYNSNKRSRPPITKMGKTMRFIKSYSEKEDLEKPGPGNYDVPSENFKGNVFIAKSKKEFIKVTLSPGPGKYKV